MGSKHSPPKQSTCTRSSSPLLSSLWLLPSLLDPQHMEPPPPMPQLRNSPLSLSPMNTALLMTTPRPTSRRLNPRMLPVTQLDLSPSPFPTAESRPPPTPLTTRTVSSLRSPMRVPLSTPRNPREDMDMPLPLSSLTPLPTTLPLSTTLPSSPTPLPTMLPTTLPSSPTPSSPTPLSLPTTVK